MTARVSRDSGRMPAHLETELLAGWRPDVFVALDFETANRSSTSACALSVVRIEGRRVARRAVCLIRPPTSHFEFTYIHGIQWADVKGERPFGPVWRSLASLVEGAQFIAAHNASFDRGVLSACCQDSDLPLPEHPFVCTVKLARLRWQLRPTKLPDVCNFLGLPLRHHDPLSDAVACAEIVLAATKAREMDPKRGASW